MKLIKQIKEAIELKDLQSGFQKKPYSIEAARAVAMVKIQLFLVMEKNIGQDKN